MNKMFQYQEAQIEMDLEVEASTSQCSTSSEHSNENNLQCPDLTQEISQNKSILKDVDVKNITKLTFRKHTQARYRKNVTEMRLQRKFKKLKICNRDVLSSLHNDTVVNNISPKALSFGINNQVIETLKKITKRRLIGDNLCVVSIDEMSMKNLSCNTELDNLGYQDHAVQGQTQQIASHALTFTAFGVIKPWDQPIANFSEDCVTADRLAVLIKEVLSTCFAAGLEVIGVVCNLDDVNLSAINLLGSSRDQPFFDHEGHEIVTILDPAQLLKCFRNNFLKHDVQYVQDEQMEGVAKWSHIEDFFNMDNTNTNFVFAPALTQQHIQPNDEQKTEVYLAAQVFSHSVAAGLFAKVAQKELPQEVVWTATLISNLDKLFDAVNGDVLDQNRGGPFLTNISSKSPHLDFFKRMRGFFAEMKFLGARNKPPSQDGWLRTMNAIERIFRNLKKYKIKTLCVRNLNKDHITYLSCRSRSP